MRRDADPDPEAIPARDRHLALAHLARLTGDRPRDVAPHVRRKVESLLESDGAPERQLRMIREVVELDEEDETQMFGDSLPPALHLV